MLVRTPALPRDPGEADPVDPGLDDAGFDGVEDLLAPYGRQARTTPRAGRFPRGKWAGADWYCSSGCGTLAQLG